MVIEVSPEQPEKASSPIEVTELGMVIEASPEQPAKAEPPISVTELPMVTDFRVFRSLNRPKLYERFRPKYKVSSGHENGQ